MTLKKKDAHLQDREATLKKAAASAQLRGLPAKIQVGAGDSTPWKMVITVPIPHSSTRIHGTQQGTDAQTDR